MRNAQGESAAYPPGLQAVIFYGPEGHSRFQLQLRSRQSVSLLLGMLQTLVSAEVLERRGD